MKKKKDHLKTRERDLKLNCILSGILFIALGAFFAVLASVTAADGEYGQLIPIYLISVLAIGVGIFMLFAPKEIMKNEAAEKDPQTRQYAQIMKRRERAHKKMRKRADNENKSLKRELFGQQTVYTAVIALISFPLVGIVFINSFGGYGVPVVVGMCLLVALVIYFGYGFGYNALKKYAERNGIDFSAVEEDFRHSSVYSCLNSFISIGCIYTVFISEGKRYILENKRIVSAMPFYEKIDNYNNGIYSGTTTRCSVIIKTEAGDAFRKSEAGGVFKIVCGEFAEELIIEAFKRNQYFMSENFTVEYPDNAPQYILK